MDHHYSTTPSRKGKHLTFEERVIIQTRLKDGLKPPAIAREIGCSPNTIRNEIRKGTVWLYHGKTPRYKAKHGQEVYETNRKNCGRRFEYLEKARFLQYVEEKFSQGWSLDVIRGRALESGEFTEEDVLSTKTLYNYVDLGLLEIKNIDLPEKLRRRHKKANVRKNKKIYGRSIEERPAEIESREEFGHWECDLVLGAKDATDKVLLTMLERKSREYLIIRLEDRHPESVMRAMREIQAKYSEHFSEVFKTITTDNGSEFSALSQLEQWANTMVYFAHPYTSCEKGAVERFNGLLRRFIPKGRRIENYSLEEISNIEVWCNSLPRKILGYRTPDEVFEEELDRIYSVVA